MFPFLLLAISTSVLDAGTKYRMDYQQYLLAKGQYIQQKTAASRLSAITKTVQVLQSRNAWQIAYLTSLGHPTLQPEIDSLQSYTAQFDSADTFQTINTLSSSWESRLTESDKLVTAARLQITAAQLSALQDSLENYFPNYSATPSSTTNLITSKLALSRSLRAKTPLTLDTLTQSHQLLKEAANLLWETHRQN